MDPVSAQALFRQLLPSLATRPFWLRFCESPAAGVDWRGVVIELQKLRGLLAAKGVVVSAKPGLLQRWLEPGMGEVSDDWLCSRSSLLAVMQAASEDPAASGACHLSLTHTHGFAAAAGLIAHQDDKAMGIGVDCERLGRAVSARVIERIRHPDDALSLKPIATWALKEACYKADPEASDRLSNYRLEHPVHEGAALGVTARGPCCRFEAGIAPIGGYWVAVGAAFR